MCSKVREFVSLKTIFLYKFEHFFVMWRDLICSTNVIIGRIVGQISIGCWISRFCLLCSFYWLTPRSCIVFYQGNQCNPASTSNFLPWPSPSDLNTRLRRIVAGFQRILKKEELKRVAVEKVRDSVLNGPISLHGYPCRNIKDFLRG